MSQVTNVTFRLEFEGGHDAMVQDPHVEVCRILDTIKQKVMAGYVESTVYDLNGNRIGEFYLGLELADEPEEEEEY